ncbi:MAG TPA: alpha/beta fold hydrolase [Ramlibacter sp.]|uniref:alpha/beta fold hydrolase n=1 Tax=Ramlibacter sp. TaxID=1917967 RepID=UPI002D80BB28|nr:alpha/beta fold hydrolase [Ramlibacter sp.]HET8746907.1 alpha/beta fold hydrolase [Ramlibacter sp.]
MASDTPSGAAGLPAGFYGETLGIRLFRLGLRGSQALWPQLAVRAAARLFTTPLPPKWLHRGAWPEGWRIEPWPFERAGLTLYTPASASEDAPVALLVHGWAGHARQLLPLAEALAEHGWRPVVLELPAHGRSAGSRSNLPQFARAIEYVVQRLQAQGRPVRLLAGHSLGANAAAYAASRGLPIERLVLLAPPASPRAYTRYFAQVFGLREPVRAGLQQHIEQREGVLMHQFEPRAVGPRIAAPTLVVHDRGDRINGFADGEAFVRAIAGARLVATEGLGHRKLLHDASVIARVVLFAAG